MTLIAKIKSGTCPPYLTEGKEYKAKLYHGPTPMYGQFFIIEDDNGRQRIPSTLKNHHLHGGDWELYEKGKE